MKQFYDLAGGVSKTGAFVWDAGALAWVRMTQPGAAAGGLTDTQLRATPVPVSGSISVSLGGFGLPAYDYISLAQATLTDTYTYKTGGAGGSTVATLTITYTTAAKTIISTVVKT
jgi:hypothetical protein